MSKHSPAIERRRKLARALELRNRYPGRRMIVLESGVVYFPNHDEHALAGEVLLAPGDEGCWSVSDLERALDRAKSAS
jgi:hypothetical protein